MDKVQLVAKLNWFYSLEISQVEMYMTQSRKTRNAHLKLALKKFADIEKGHVENIRELIEKMGHSPTVLGETAAEFTGKLAGTLSGLASREKTLRFNIAIEKKAIADYKKAIKQVDDPAIREVLWSNMIDEELHTAWMSRHIRRMRH